jgi:hypothetical protein
VVPPRCFVLTVKEVYRKEGYFTALVFLLASIVVYLFETCGIWTSNVTFEELLQDRRIEPGRGR